MPGEAPGEETQGQVQEEPAEAQGWEPHQPSFRSAVGLGAAGGRGGREQGSLLQGTRGGGQGRGSGAQNGADWTWPVPLTGKTGLRKSYPAPGEFLRVTDHGV